MQRTPALLLIAALVGGCSDSDSDSDAEVLTSPLKVVSYNLYLGADIAPILQASDAAAVVAACSNAWGQVIESDFPARAVAIADQIEAEDPDLIGLQEVTLFRTQDPADFVQPPNAIDVVYDYLEILQNELTSRGLSYDVVSQIENADIEMPTTIDFMDFVDVRVTDRDVILAKTGTVTGGPLAVRFSPAVTLSVSIGDDPGTPADEGTLTSVHRGWCSINAMAGDTWFTFVNTHLETVLDLGIPGTHPAEAYFQEGQAVELMVALASFPTPVVLVGDFNSAGDGSTSRSYPNTINAGFSDAWTSALGDGYTCCQEEDVANADSTLTERIDFILGNGGVSFSDADRIGEDVADKVNNGVHDLWPSDHSGVVATAHIPQ